MNSNLRFCHTAISPQLNVSCIYFDYCKADVTTVVFLYLLILAATARQPLFPVILSQSIYLCLFVRIFSPLQCAGQPLDAWCSVCGCILIVFPHYNLSSREDMSPDIGVRDLAAPAKKELPTCFFI